MTTGLTCLTILAALLVNAAGARHSITDSLRKRVEQNSLAEPSKRTSDLLQLLVDRWFCSYCAGDSTKGGDIKIKEKDDDDSIPDSVDDILKGNWWNGRK